MIMVNPVCWTVWKNFLQYSKIFKLIFNFSLFILLILLNSTNSTANFNYLKIYNNRKSKTIIIKISEYL